MLPTPVFWPREFHGLYSPWDCKESDTPERVSHTHTHTHIYIVPNAFYFMHCVFSLSIVSADKQNLIFHNYEYKYFPLWFMLCMK